MKILYINAMGPYEAWPQAGVFVSERVAALRKNGVDVTACSYYQINSPAVQRVVTRNGGTGSGYSHRPAGGSDLWYPENSQRFLFRSNAAFPPEFLGKTHCPAGAQGHGGIQGRPHPSALDLAHGAGCDALLPGNRRALCADLPWRRYLFGYERYEKTSLYPEDAGGCGGGGVCQQSASGICQRAGVFGEKCGCRI